MPPERWAGFGLVRIVFAALTADPIVAARRRAPAEAPPSAEPV